SLIIPTLAVTPTMVGGEPITHVSAGGNTMVVTQSGAIWAWGRGGSGQIGDGNQAHRFAPTKVANVDGTTFLAAAAGYFHSLALDSDGHVWAWGSAQYGQIGDAKNLSRKHQPNATDLMIYDNGTRAKFTSVA